jgi:arylsulfatase A-like enzyme
MNARQATTCSNRELFYTLSLLTVFFILIEFSFFIQSFHTFFSQFTFAAKGLTLPANVIPGIVGFIFIQLGLHLFFLLCTYVVSISILDLFPKLRRHGLTIAMVIWFIGIASALIANQIYYPNARFSKLFEGFLPDFLLHNFLVVFLLIDAALMIISLYCSKSLRSVTVITILTLTSYFIFNNSMPAHDAATPTQPNIIIIGIDSLRPDFLSYFGGDEQTPFLDSILQTSSVFSEAVTPLARTFPAWMSILTGLHPKILGLRSDLAKYDMSYNEESLQLILKSVGYQTMYATDESRFNNIDASYGFDRSITPPMGLNDFIIGTINDFPFSNLLLNTRLGAWLFPNSYGNRPAYFNYNPDSFLHLLENNLSTNRQKPLFLAIHFCLPHHPYLWAELDTRTTLPREWYEQSIVRADKQIKDFFAILKAKKLLEHSIVVLLSDHGEALELDGDRITEKDLYVSSHPTKDVPHFYPPSNDYEDVNQSGGHGTDVLGLPQFHSLLAFKLYGASPQQAGTISGAVSLMDIKPTILELLKINKATKTNGVSLARAIRGEKYIGAPRHIIIESDFSPEALRAAYPDVNKVVLEGLHIYEIDPVTSRLSVKPDMQTMIIKSKQYADIYDHWMLALYPIDGERIAILVDLQTGRWTNDFSSTFAKLSPATKMHAHLKLFYSNDLM